MLDTLLSLSRGGTYPLPMAKTDGAAANFLISGGNFLQIGLSNVARSEAQAIRKGPMKAGLIVDGPLILWVFTFGSIIFECPFDSRLISKNDLQLFDIKGEAQRLVVDVHLVDTSSNLVRGLRVVTLSPSLTSRFLSAVQDQLSDARRSEPFLSRYSAFSMQELTHLAKVEAVGI